MNFDSKRLATIVAMLTLLAACVFAQSTSGDLVGTVYDSTGAVIPNAAVTATNVATGIQTTTTATSSGQYRLSNLPVGTYNLKAKAAGFSEAEVKSVEVSLNKTGTANFTLQVGTTSTTVEVSESSVISTPPRRGAELL